MKPLVTPVINMNGNPASTLVIRLMAVSDAIRDLEEAMVLANDVCHGRNFQTVYNGEQKQIEATHAWAERRVWLEQLQRDVTNLTSAISEQSR